MVIDDDPMTTSVLHKLIDKTDRLDLLGIYNDPEEGITAVIADQPDLIFVDIEMPKLSGTDIIKNLPYRPSVIIISGSTAYAAEAFELDVTDHLIKPLDNYARFLKSLEKARKFLTKEINFYSPKIFLKVDSSIINIEKAHVLYIKAYGDYVKMVTIT